MSDLEVRITFLRDGKKVGTADFLPESFRGAAWEASCLIAEWADENEEATSD